MNLYRVFLFLPAFLIAQLSLCLFCPSTANEISVDNNSQSFTIYDSTHHDDFCDYFYSKDTLGDTLYFNFQDREDFGPVLLSGDELKQIYCEIKRGNIDAYRILNDHYFYSYSLYIPKSAMDKLICITEFLAQKYYYYRGYLECGNCIFDYLKYNTDDYYTATMISYYEKYFGFSQSTTVAERLYEIYCGNYSFHEKDSIKAKYYEGFLFNK